MKVKVAILGPGNIGLDLMYKLKKRSQFMELALMAGIAESDGIRLAQREGFQTSTAGIDSILAREDIRIVFDATLAAAHLKHAPLLKAAGKKAIDLTPAAVGPYVVPCCNLEDNLDADNVNLITCGGQATIPIVYAINRVLDVDYAEIVATIASPSAGPGTRQSIDEFTITTATGLRAVGGAKRSKAIILLNPAEPPMMMNNTVYCIPDMAKYSPKEIEAALPAVCASVTDMIAQVQQYVPGYALKIPPQYDGRRILCMVEVAGAGDYLPKYSGNLDIETSAALAIGERIAANLLRAERGGAAT